MYIDIDRVKEVARKAKHRFRIIGGVEDNLMGEYYKLTKETPRTKMIIHNIREKGGGNRTFRFPVKATGVAATWKKFIQSNITRARRYAQNGLISEESIKEAEKLGRQWNKMMECIRIQNLIPKIPPPTNATVVTKERSKTQELDEVAKEIGYCFKTFQTKNGNIRGEFHKREQKFPEEMLLFYHKPDLSGNEGIGGLRIYITYPTSDRNIYRISELTPANADPELIMEKWKRVVKEWRRKHSYDPKELIRLLQESKETNPNTPDQNISYSAGGARECH